MPHNKILQPVPRLKKLKHHKKVLSTLYESYKDNIEEPYKEEFRKTLYGPSVIKAHHGFHIPLPGDHTSSTRDSNLKKSHYRSQATSAHKNNTSMSALAKK